MTAPRARTTRLAAVGANAYRTLTDLGLESQIVAWTDDALPSPRRLEHGRVLGAPGRIELEELSAAGPGLVVVDVPSCGPRLVAEMAERFALFRLDATTLIDVRLELEDLGAQLGRVPEARSLSLALQAEELRIRTERAGARPLRVLVPLAREPWRIAAGRGYIAECLEICGARSPLADVPEEDALWTTGHPMPSEYDAVLWLTPRFTQEDGEVLAAAPELADKPMRFLDERALTWRGSYAAPGLRDLDATLASLRG